MIAGLLWGLLKLSPLIIGGAALVLFITSRSLFDKILSMLLAMVTWLFTTPEGRVTLVLGILLFSHIGAYRWGVRHERNDNQVVKLRQENANLKKQNENLQATIADSDLRSATVALGEAELQGDLNVFRLETSKQPLRPVLPRNIEFYNRIMRQKSP